MTSTTIPEDMPLMAQNLVFIIIARAHEVVAREQHPPVVFLCQQATEAIMPMALDTTDTQHAAQEVRQAARMMGADLSILVSEGWALPEKYECDIERGKAEHRKYGRLENHPERVEVLFVNVETKAYCWMGRAPILRAVSKKGARRVGPVTFTEAVSTSDSFGALNNLLGLEATPR